MSKTKAASPAQAGERLKEMEKTFNLFVKNVLKEYYVLW